MAAIDDLLNAVTDQLDKAKTEILAEIDKLSSVEAPSQETIDRLRAAAQGLDDVVPDVPPVEPPVEEPVTEEPT